MVRLYPIFLLAHMGCLILNLNYLTLKISKAKLLLLNVNNMQCIILWLILVTAGAKVLARGKVLEMYACVVGTWTLPALMLSLLESRSRTGAVT